MENMNLWGKISQPASALMLQRKHHETPQNLRSSVPGERQDIKQGMGTMMLRVNGCVTLIVKCSLEYETIQVVE